MQPNRDGSFSASTVGISTGCIATTCRTESRIHVHVICADGEAKFWLEPELELAKNEHLGRSQLRQIEQIIERHYDELTSAWGEHFRS